MALAAPRETSARASVMQAAVLVDVGRIEVRDVPRPDIQPHEIRVRMTAVGICGTDLHIVAGHANYNRDERGRTMPLSEHPQILGHEIAGVIEEVGAAVHDVRPGEHVVIDQGRNCISEGRAPCEYCTTSDSHQCEFYREHGITGLPGGLATYLAIPAVNAIRVQSGIDDTVAVMTEPLGCVVHSMERLMRTPARFSLHGERSGRVRCAMICGAGPAGLLFVQYLRRVLGFDGLILMSEPNDYKRALAERLGADGIDAKNQDVAQWVRDRTAGRGVELLVEASGSGSVFASIARLVRKQATVLLYGHGHAGVDLSVLSQLQFLEPTLLSPVGASGGFAPDGRPTTYSRALRLIEQGAVDVSSLLTHRYAFPDSVGDAFAADHHAPGYVKGVVTF
jgi:L-iditol 2-dehydrogenase